MSFVPQPPQIVFFSDKYVDSFKHMSGVLTFPIVSIFKGVAPLHCGKKHALHQKQVAYRHKVGTVKAVPHNPQNIHSQIFSNILSAEWQGLRAHYGCPKNTACVNRYGTELGLMTSTTAGLVQKSHIDILEKIQTGPYSSSAGHCNSITALCFLWAGANPQEPAYRNGYWHLFICSVNRTLTSRESKQYCLLEASVLQRENIVQIEKKKSNYKSNN